MRSGDGRASGQTPLIPGPAMQDDIGRHVQDKANKDGGIIQTRDSRSLLGKNISANILSNIWSALLLLILTPFYIRFLGVECYGLIGFYASWIAILGILDTGISETAVREIAWISARPEERGRIPTLLRSLEIVYWGIVLAIGVGVLAWAWFFGAEWFHAKDLPPDVLRDALMLMAVSMVAQVPSGLYIGGMMGLQRQVECSGLVAFFVTVRGVGALLVLWQIYPDIRAFFLWQIVASILQTGMMRWLLWRRIRVAKLPCRFSLEALHSVKGFTGGMILITALSIIMSQVDKLILSRMVSLEVFGFYMLAWVAASGLMRISTPLLQAFSPHFTELLSRGDKDALLRQVSFASQLMSVLILPPAILLAFFSEPILHIWTGNPAIAAGASPLLVVMVAGMVLSACSYPALSILYSKKQLRPVIAVNLASLLVLLPLLVVAIAYFGAMGAALIWGIYGLILYVAYQAYGLRKALDVDVLLSMLRDFVAPCAVSIVVVGTAWFWRGEVEGNIAFVALLGVTLAVGWFVALMACKDLLKIVVGRLTWKAQSNL